MILLLWRIAELDYGDVIKCEDIWNKIKENLHSGNPDLIHPGEKIRIKLPAN